MGRYKGINTIAGEAQEDRDDVSESRYISHNSSEVYRHRRRSLPQLLPTQIIFMPSINTMSK